MVRENALITVHVLFIIQVFIYYKMLLLHLIYKFTYSLLRFLANSSATLKGDTAFLCVCFFFHEKMSLSDHGSTSVTNSEQKLKLQKTDTSRLWRIWVRTLYATFDWD